MTIFIVEDDKPLRETFSEVLRHLGYRVAAAANGVDALERIRIDRPSFIFVDLIMPVMSGFELIRALQADAQLSTIPVAAMTASTATTIPGVLFMKKPFRAETAIALIEMYSDAPRRHRAKPADEKMSWIRSEGLARSRALRRGQPRVAPMRRRQTTR